MMERIQVFESSINGFNCARATSNWTLVINLSSAITTPEVVSELPEQFPRSKNGKCYSYYTCLTIVRMKQLPFGQDMSSTGGFICATNIGTLEMDLYVLKQVRQKVSGNCYNPFPSLMLQ